jgi:phytoene synthase
MNPIDAYKICADLAAPRGSATYYSSLFLEKPKRRPLSALYAFQQNVLAIRAQCSDKQVALAKLNWWREEIHKTFHSTPTHPVGIALQPSLTLFPLSYPRFQNVLNAVEADLHTSIYSTDQELYTFYRRSSGEIEVIAASILGELNTQTIDAAYNLGTGFQIVNNLVNLRPLLKAGVVYLSEEKLQQYPLTLSELMQYKFNDQVRDLILDQLSIAENYFEAALSSRKLRSSYPGSMLHIQQKLINAIREENGNVLTQHIRLTPLQMLWSTVKTYWKY